MPADAMMDDAALVARFQQGDEQAFDLLVDRHRRRVYSLVCRLAPPGEADDLAQEVFLAAYRALPGFRGDARFTTWLYRISVHVCSHHMRRRRWETDELDEGSPDPEPDHDPERRVLAGELKDRVQRAIGALPYKLRLVVVLRDMHGLGYEEIARVVGCPVGTVRSRLHYATARLVVSLRPYVDAR